MLSGAPVDILCEHNAHVSEAAKRPQVAEAWVSPQTVKIFFKKKYIIGM